MSRAGPFFLVHEVARRNAIEAVRAAEQGMMVTIRKPNRSLDQNAKFHAAVDDIAKARPEWAGIRMDADDWKALLILSHAIATGGQDGALRMVPDLEGKGFVQLRESSAKMSKERSSSLIEYTVAWAVSHGIALNDSESRADKRDGCERSEPQPTKALRRKDEEGEGEFCR